MFWFGQLEGLERGGELPENPAPGTLQDAFGRRA